MTMTRNGLLLLCFCFQATDGYVFPEQYLLRSLNRNHDTIKNGIATRRHGLKNGALSSSGYFEDFERRNNGDRFNRNSNTNNSFESSSQQQRQQQGTGEIRRRPPDRYSAGPLSTARIPDARSIWREENTALIQGNTLRTWPLSTAFVDMIQLTIATEGRPLNANVELWQGPDYTPSNMKVYIEDGNLRPLNVVFMTPSTSNTVAVYNTGNMEFPFYASVEESIEPGLATSVNNPLEWSVPTRVQGGALKSYAFEAAVQSVQILLNTDGRNLKARLELMNGPNNDKQIIEFYSSDGMVRPIYVVMETPGTGNVVRVINQNPVEFPFTAFVGPFEVDARSIQD